MIVIATALAASSEYAAVEGLPMLCWRNVVAAGSVTADTEATDYPATNVANPSTALKWIAADTTEQYLTIGVGGVDVDYIAIAGHNLGTAGIDVSVEGQETVSWAELVAATTLADDRAAIFRFETIGLNGIRLKLPTGDDPAEIAVVYVGLTSHIPAGVPPGFTPLPFGTVSDVTNGRSEAGAFLGRIETGAYEESAVTLEALDLSWARGELAAFLAAGRNLPFFFAWSPADYPAETGFAALAGSPQPKLDVDWASISMTMIGVAP